LSNAFDKSNEQTLTVEPLAAQCSTTFLTEYIAWPQLEAEMDFIVILRRQRCHMEQNYTQLYLHTTTKSCSNRKLLFLLLLLLLLLWNRLFAKQDRGTDYNTIA